MKLQISLFNSLVSFISISCLSTSVVFAEPLALVADPYCPYNCNVAADSKGILVDVASAIFAKHDLQVEYSELPWTRAIDLTRNGEYDGVAGTDQISAAGFVFPDKPFVTINLMFWVKAGSQWKYKNVADLLSVRLGVIKDYSYGADLDTYIVNNTDKVTKETGVNALSKLIRELDGDMLDVVIEDQAVFTYALAHDPKFAKKANAFVPVGTAWSFPLYMAFSPKKESSKAYVKILNDELEAFKGTEAWASILKKYGL